MKSAAPRRLALAVTMLWVTSGPAFAQEAEAPAAAPPPTAPADALVDATALDFVAQRLAEEMAPLQAAVIATPEPVTAPEPAGLQPIIDAIVGNTTATPVAPAPTAAMEVNRTGEGLAPQPSIVPRDWEFDFVPGPMRTIAVPDIAGRQRIYWYMTYKVTNNGDLERPFVPEVTLVTDAGDIIDAGAKVPPGVFEAIKQKMGNPLLDNPNAVVGRLLIGRDNARESVAIWPAPSHDVDWARVFVAGLSGETARTTVGAAGDAVLRKTLLLHFDTPGSPASPAATAFIPGPTRWVMR